MNVLNPALSQAITFLETQGYRYAVIGGIANQLWGEERFTHDVDLKVIVPDLDYAAVRAAIRTAFPEPGRPHAPDNPFIVSVNIKGIIVDFLLALPGYEEQIITRATRCDLGDLQAWVCAPEDLVIQKAIAGRPKDWQDIEGVLIEQWGRLDLIYLEDWLAQFAELLEQPEIVSQYRAIQNRIAAVRGEAE
ncbi:MAG: nucleotidyltransferase [Chloroflexi bacterium]|nr:nucleotidyltransferase [Chloroflexota bacterium]